MMSTRRSNREPAVSAMWAMLPFEFSNDMAQDEQGTSHESKDASAISFPAFVLSLAHTAAVHFGDIPDPVTGTPRGVQSAGRPADDRYPVAAGTEDARKTDGRGAAAARADLYELRMRYMDAVRGTPSGSSSPASSPLTLPDPGMNVPVRVTFLGTGTSSGVPVIACECAVCRSTDPHPRLRPSIYIDVPGHARILVDTTSELRQQALAHASRASTRCSSPTATRITSSASTMSGVSTRPGRADSVLRGRRSVGDIRKILYVFDGNPARRRRAQLDQNDVDGPFTVGGARVIPVPLWHGTSADPWISFRRVRVSHRLQSASRRSRGRCASASRWWWWVRCATSPTPRTSRGSRGRRRHLPVAALRAYPDSYGPRPRPRRHERPSAPVWSWHMMGSCSTWRSTPHRHGG